mgnify:CR=1 FL=1
MNTKSIAVENIETSLGNEITEDLKNEGWKLKDQYSEMMFDKAIDYDYYIFKKDKDRIKFEWDNWFEWKVLGEEKVILKIKEKYKL